MNDSGETGSFVRVELCANGIEVMKGTSENVRRSEPHLTIESDGQLRPVDWPRMLNSNRGKKNDRHVG